MESHFTLGRLLICFLGCSLFLSGCINKPTPNYGQKTTLTEDFSTIDEVTTPSLDEIKSVSSISDPTGTPSQTLTTRKTSTPTPNLVFRPTLMENLANDELNKFLLQTENCSSPCIFGVIPGHTTFMQAEENFYWLRHPLYEKTYLDGEKYYFSDINLTEKNIWINIEIMKRAEVVNNMVAYIKLPDDTSTITSKEYLAFVPGEIIKRYGQPSFVGFGISFPTEPGFPENLAWYHMTLEYKEDNLIFDYYNAQVIEGIDYIEVCPNKDVFSSLSVYLGQDVKYPPILGVPLSDVTTLTIDDYSKILLQNAETACFNISKSAYFLDN